MDGSKVRRDRVGLGGTVELGWFVTPHGLGHAARAAAIMTACSELCPSVRHHVFTTVPRRFFSDGPDGIGVDHHHLECDVGMIQKTPFEEDVPATVGALDRLPLGDEIALDRLARAVAATGVQAIVCDISPLGLEVAARLGLPAALVQNFTWDWIYRVYDDRDLTRHGERLREVFASAQLVIETDPVCHRMRNSVTVAPVSRDVATTRNEIRARLGVPSGHRLIVLSISGLDSGEIDRRGFALPESSAVARPAPHGVVIDGAGATHSRVVKGIYHPDLVAASDLVIGKLGYSTVAEVYHAATAFAYLARPRFPESPVLESFVQEHGPSARLPEDWLVNPQTTRILTELLDASRPTGSRPNGAGDAARLVLDLVKDDRRS